MEAAANAVPAVLAHHREAFRFDKLLDRRAESAQADARLHHLQRQVEALLGHTAQALTQNGRLANDKHFRGIAVETVFDHGNVDVNDVAVFQAFLVVRNTVTHHFVDRDADGFREAVVAEAGGNRVLLVNDMIVTDTIQLAGAYARFNVRFDHLQHFRSEAACHAHFFDIFRGLNWDSHEFCPLASTSLTIKSSTIIV